MIVHSPNIKVIRNKSVEVSAKKVPTPSESQSGTGRRGRRENKNMYMSRRESDSTFIMDMVDRRALETV